MLDEVADRWEIDCAEGGAKALEKAGRQKI